MASRRGRSQSVKRVYCFFLYIFFVVFIKSYGHYVRQSDVFCRAYLMTDLIIINHIGAIEIQIKEFLFYFSTDIRESSTFASMKLALNIGFK